MRRMLFTVFGLIEGHRNVLAIYRYPALPRATPLI